MRNYRDWIPALLKSFLWILVAFLGAALFIRAISTTAVSANDFQVNPVDTRETPEQVLEQDMEDAVAENPVFPQTNTVETLDSTESEEPSAAVYEVPAASPVAPAQMPDSVQEPVQEPAPVDVDGVYDVPLTDAEMTALLDKCEEHGIDVSVALGLIQVESSFDRDAVNSDSGCYGYCQLNPKYFPSDLSGEENIKNGLDCLAGKIKQYGSLEAALTAYNAGHDTGDRQYAGRVLAAAKKWEK